MSKIGRWYMEQASYCSSSKTEVKVITTIVQTAVQSVLFKCKRKVLIETAMTQPCPECPKLYRFPKEAI